MHLPSLHPLFSHSNFFIYLLLFDAHWSDILPRILIHCHHVIRSSLFEVVEKGRTGRVRRHNRPEWVSLYLSRNRERGRMDQFD
jgi:hypothetical protein